MTRPILIALALALTAGCSEYGLTGEDDVDEPPPEPEPPVVDVAQDVLDRPEPPPPEICNGEDDDLDGEVDEGFPDHDGDGVADCDACDELNVAVADVWPLDETCRSTLPDDLDPWKLVVEWEWNGVDGKTGPAWYSDATPLVGQLTDDDGDGDIDADDDPDIVVGGQQGYVESLLVAIDGRTGKEHWAVPVTPAYFNALGDVNGDGRTDVVTMRLGGVIVHNGDDGSVLWNTTLDPRPTGNPSIADLDGDGDAEVIVDGWILDGTTGAAQARVAGDGGSVLAAPAIGDLDLDGEQEIVIKNKVYRADGSLWWSAGTALDEWKNWGSYPTIVQADSDPEAEVAILANGTLGVYEHDGTEITLVSVGKRYTFPPAAADFDGDGDVELAFVSLNVFMPSTSDAVLTVVDMDGTVVWAQNVDNWSGTAPVAAFDFNADGAVDILDASEASVSVLDGRDGTLRLKWTDRVAPTKSEYATVADIDKDGSAEIIYATGNFMSGMGSGSDEGVTVLGNPDGAWPPGLTYWNQHAFTVTNITEDGDIPASPEPSWQKYNLYRGAPAGISLAAPDLRARITDVCFLGCKPWDTVRVAVQIANEGPAAAGPEIPVTLYRDDAGTLTPIWTGKVGELERQSAGDGWIVEVRRDDVGADGIVLRVNDDGSGGEPLDECDLDDNEMRWNDQPCAR